MEQPPEEVERNGAAIVEALAQGHPVAGDLPIDFSAVIALLEASEDATYGGFGGAPKFPVSPVLRFLVERGAPLAERTLDAMAASPLRDRWTADSSATRPVATGTIRTTSGCSTTTRSS